MPASHCDRIAPVATLGTNIVSEDGKAVWNLAAPLLLGLAIAALLLVRRLMLLFRGGSSMEDLMTLKAAGAR